jgi:prephenate dehydrogenase
MHNRREAETGNRQGSKSKGMNVAIIGTGLIGGSMALSLRDLGIATRVIGVEASEEHRKRALERGLVDETAELEQAVAAADLVIVAIPVHAVEEYCRRCLTA